ncbi:phosphotransferase family protein [Angustibacter sp. McL0619]|uniref:phosphotransferase family protein n=1 Tax=Angustibacter sp. McL0619 TaxID=3415676 RepID=UPI003CEC3808
MKAALVARAASAVSSLGRELDLHVSEAVVIQNSNKLALRLLPCDVFARTAQVGQEVAAFEVLVAEALAAVSAPVVSLDRRVEPGVYERDGFAVTFWTHYASTSAMAAPPMYARAMHHLHAAMRSIEVDAPHFTERVAAAEDLLTSRDETPELRDADRRLLLDTIQDARQAVRGRRRSEQLLHGEPHPGNLLNTPDGLLFIDLETCCRGPIEFDLAHAPEEVTRLYPDADLVLVQECRRLVIAMVAAWRWDVHDEFPQGRRHGLNLLDVLGQGPPWPALGPLATD